jgi:hypothetical protein
MSSGKFRLTHSEVSLLQTQIDASNTNMINLLGDQFVQAQTKPIEKLNSQDMLDFMTGLAKIDR